MPKRDPKVRLLHMRDYARKAVGMAVALFSGGPWAACRGTCNNRRM